MSPPVAEFQSLSKVYRTGLFHRRPVWALRNVTLTVPRGSLFAVLGPNRAGKTTLIKTLLSICRPSSGSIVRLGRPAEDRSTLARIGYLHESQAFPRYLPAREVLWCYGRLSGVTAGTLRRRIPQLLAEVDLADRAGEPLRAFSKGMVQRLALAQALVNDPDLLVLDEPTEGMDLAARKLLQDLLRRRQRQGKTAILVSHSLADVQQLCDSLAVLRRGQVALAGSLSALVGHDGAAAPLDALEDALAPIYAGGAP
jgi:ABC-2 type transport system ATP-binding protein